MTTGSIIIHVLSLYICQWKKYWKTSRAIRIITVLIFAVLGIPIIPMSTLSEDGVMNVKTEACDRLLAQRVEVKLKHKRVDGVLNRLHVSVPKPRDNIERPPFIPDSVKNKGT